MTYILENKKLKVTIANIGAELISVYDKENAVERMWDANPTVWNRHAPILFPFVGKLTNNQYHYKNTISIHNMVLQEIWNLSVSVPINSQLHIV